MTPQCTAALAAVLDALGKRAGPEDLRTKDQRTHDAIEEPCRRLVVSNRSVGDASALPQASVAGPGVGWMYVR